MKSTSSEFPLISVGPIQPTKNKTLFFKSMGIECGLRKDLHPYQKRTGVRRQSFLIFTTQIIFYLFHVLSTDLFFAFWKLSFLSYENLYLDTIFTLFQAVDTDFYMQFLETPFFNLFRGLTIRCEKNLHFEANYLDKPKFNYTYCVISDNRFTAFST